MTSLRGVPVLVVILGLAVGVAVTVKCTRLVCRPDENAGIVEIHQAMLVVEKEVCSLLLLAMALLVVLRTVLLAVPSVGVLALGVLVVGRVMVDNRAVPVLLVKLVLAVGVAVTVKCTRLVCRPDEIAGIVEIHGAVLLL